MQPICTCSGKPTGPLLGGVKCPHRHPPIGKPGLAILPIEDSIAMESLMSDPNFEYNVACIVAEHDRRWQLEIWCYPDQGFEVHVLDEPASRPNIIIIRYFGTIEIIAELDTNVRRDSSSLE